MREEITLRDLIEMILKRKWIICIVTVIAILVSGLYSFFYLVPTYRATSTLLTSPIEGKQTNISEGINEIIDSLAIYPDMTINTYKEQIINNAVLKDTINDLKLVNSNGEPIQCVDLANKISVDIIDKTNILKISVNDKDPEKAASIANSLSKNFIKYISDNTRKFGEQATLVIEERLKDEEDKLEEVSKKLKDYLAKSQNVEQLKLEVQSLYDKINTYKMNLIDIESQINADSIAIKSLLDDNETFSKINLDGLKINIPLDNTEDTQDMEFVINSSNELQGALITINATNIETRIIQNQASKISLEEKIKELESRLLNTQTVLAEEEYKYNAIQRSYKLAEQTYNAYLDRHKEAVIAASSNIGESVIIISSPADVPIKPSNHGKMYFLALGTIAGLMIGVFMTFVVAYWKDYDPRKNEKRS